MLVEGVGQGGEFEVFGGGAVESLIGELVLAGVLDAHGEEVVRFLADDLAPEEELGGVEGDLKVCEADFELHAGG